MKRSAVLVAAVLVLLSVATASADGDCGSADAAAHDRVRARLLKIVAFFSILVCGALGCCVPVLGQRAPALQPDGDVFFLIKAFAAGVILATGFIHVLPDAFENLTSDCLPSGGPWKEFPFAGLGAMVGAIGTLVVDTVATGYFMRAHFKKDDGAHTAASSAAFGDEEMQASGAEGARHLEDGGEHEGIVPVRTHATHGHAHGSSALFAAVGGAEDNKQQTVRHRVISQVLELGIIVHSVIIGISLGASQDPDTIKPLVVALSFHQMFEGMGLGGCIVQAKFKVRSILTMILFFCLTTPVGIVVGMGMSSVYNENSPTALVVEGLLNSVTAGILIYMAIVNFLAEDFMNPNVQSRGKLQLGINVSMLLGAGLMSMLAKWAETGFGFEICRVVEEEINDVFLQLVKLFPGICQLENARISNDWVKDRWVDIDTKPDMLLRIPSDGAQTRQPDVVTSSRGLDSGSSAMSDQEVAAVQANSGVDKQTEADTQTD